MPLDGKPTGLGCAHPACQEARHHEAQPRSVAGRLLKLPIHLYRWTVRPWLGWPCRHLPSCSDYALEAIDKNGPWRGFWLTLSRLSRCHPWGSAGHDPVPDIRGDAHRFAPWRYGRWTGRHIVTRWEAASKGSDRKDAVKRKADG